jgi:MoaA/NifB/PqqE/SkfB family radical SAM enzyme
MKLVVLDPTGHCNLRCGHCFADGYKALHPSRDDLLDTIRLLPDGFGVYIIGGEPLLRDDIFELIQACVQQGHRTSIATNATLIDSSVADNLIKSGISSINCSLDGPSPQVHDALRGPGAWRRAMDGILCLNEALTDDEALTICLTINSINYCHVEETMAMLDQKGVYANIFLERTVALGRAVENAYLVPSDEQWLEACEQLCRGWKRWPRLLNLTFYLPSILLRLVSVQFGVVLKESRYLCPLLTGEVWGRIFPDGRLYSCGRRNILEEAAAKGLLPDEGQIALEVLKKQPSRDQPYPSSVERLHDLAAAPDHEFCLSCLERTFCLDCPAEVLLGKPFMPSLCMLGCQRYTGVASNAAPAEIDVPGRKAVAQQADGVQVRPDAYTKDLRSGAKMLFVPGNPYALRLTGEATAAWNSIAAGHSLPYLKLHHPSIPFIGDVSLNVEDFLVILQRYGTVESWTA